METLNKEFWEKRDAAMKRFMASKERKRKRMAELDNFFETNEFALLYICETGDRKQALRNRLFDSWFAYANGKEQYVIMVANIQDLEGVNNYAAMILRKDNPNFVDYVSEFNNTVNLFMLKPEH